MKLEIEISDNLIDKMERTVELVGFRDREELVISAIMRLLDRLEVI